ncbi:hypothetical protein RKE29_26320 [Streptomyces sp. B1866]|uniref:imine reductase family protein n=1 Tax=Streptomyces sp. B1866 TaxID=3075431 RepID=UPI00289295D2|nr:hypothetical protein [Streptomyces sp. B1866]MDT3400099.1 hypothetical protein [Streptomyces sp. B1866]
MDRLAMGAASAGHVLHTARDAGVDDALPAAVAEVFRRGLAAGYGGDSFTSLVRLFAAPAA